MGHTKTIENINVWKQTETGAGARAVPKILGEPKCLMLGE